MSKKLLIAALAATALTFTACGKADEAASKAKAKAAETAEKTADKMGEAAARFLIQRVEQEIEEKQVVYRTEIIQATLVERESTNKFAPAKLHS